MPRANYKPLMEFQYSCRLKYGRKGRVNYFKYKGRKVKAFITPDGKKLQILKIPKTLQPEFQNVEKVIPYDSRNLLEREKREFKRELAQMLNKFLKKRGELIRENLKDKTFFENGEEREVHFGDGECLKYARFMPYEVAKAIFRYRKYMSEKNLAELEAAIEKAVNDPILGNHFAAFKHSLRSPKKLEKILKELKPKKKLDEEEYAGIPRHRRQASNCLPGGSEAAARQVTYFYVCYPSDKP